MKKLLTLLFSLLISFNSYGGLFGITSIEDTTCTDLQKEAKGSKLKNLVGGEFKVLKVSNSREISRTKDKLVCIGDLKLDNGVSNSKLRMELTNEDGELWYQYKQEINSTYDNQTESSKKTVEDIISTSVNLQDTISCQEITDKDKRLSCYDSLSDGLTSSNVKVIPSITKLLKEKKLTIGGSQNPFYGCISEIFYTDKDNFTGKSNIRNIIIDDSANLIIKEFEVFEKGDPDSPKVGGCFAFVGPPMENLNGFYVSWNNEAQIYSEEYLVDEKVVKPVFKDKLTVDEYCEREVEYGKNIVELTGIVEEANGKENKNWFRIKLLAECDSYFATYYDSNLWKNSDEIKNKLLSIKPGDAITLRGHFGGMNGFQIIEILESPPEEVTFSDDAEKPPVCNEPEFVEIDENNKLIKIYNKSFTGKSICFYENGMKLSEGNLINGREDGKWTKWYSNGQKKELADYTKGQYDGRVIGWYSGGQKSYEWSTQGKSTYIEWHLNGHLAVMMELYDDILDGKYIIWDRFGEIEFDTTYKGDECISGDCY